MKCDFRTVTSKAKVREGTFTDVATGVVKPLNWAGHWGRGNIKGVLIPFKYLPKIEIEVGKVYRVKFDYKDKKNDHHVDEFVVLVGLSGIEDPLDKRNHTRFIIFQSVTNLEVLKYKRESGC